MEEVIVIDKYLNLLKILLRNYGKVLYLHLKEDGENWFNQRKFVEGESSSSNANLKLTSHDSTSTIDNLDDIIEEISNTNSEITKNSKSKTSLTGLVNEKPDAQKLYSRKHMLGLIQSIGRSETLESSKPQSKIKSSINETLNKQIDKLCKWTEMNLGSGIVSHDELLKSIDFYLPFIPIIKELCEASDTNCIKGLPANFQVKQTVHLNKKDTGRNVQCKKANKPKETKLDSSAQKKNTLINKITNAAGVKLYIDYVRAKVHRNPLGLK